MTLALTGTGLGRGVAIGQIHKLVANELEIQEYKLPEDSVEAEVRRFRKALEAAKSHLETLAKQLRDSAGTAAEEIIATHLHMLDDAVLVDETRAFIENSQCNAEWALQLQLDIILAEFKNLDDQYIRSREEDIIQVVRLIQQMLGGGDNPVPEKLTKQLDDTIVVAQQLAPNELAQLHERSIAGLVTEHGSRHSHTAILAKSLRIPTLVGVPMAQRLLHESEAAILDSRYGVLLAAGRQSLQQHYRKKQKAGQRHQKNLERYRRQPCVSQDKVPVMLMANAERSQDIKAALDAGAMGVGLFRTEFLYVSGETPGEEQQYQSFVKALKQLKNRPLIIRTLDFGADKPGSFLHPEHSRSVPNPALGLRALRLCLRNPDLFKPQLKAILRAAAQGNVGMMLPMLTRVSELQRVRQLIAECSDELKQDGQAHREDLQLGGMIEVPAAAMLVDVFAEQLDFLSIGTNDLIQYLLAVDRVDEQVSQLYDPLHPAVLKLLGNIIDTGRNSSTPVTLCGELAGDPGYTRLLLALGLRQFSMHPGSLLEVKQVILSTHIRKTEDKLREMLKQPGVFSPMDCLEALNR